jgi:hypothetical protein
MFDVEAHEADDVDEHPLFATKPQPPALSNRRLLFAVESPDDVEVDLTA